MEIGHIDSDNIDSLSDFLKSLCVFLVFYFRILLFSLNDVYTNITAAFLLHGRHCVLYYTRLSAIFGE